jgi:hypothetical protein
LLYTNDPRVDYQVAEIKKSLGIANTLKSSLGLQITKMRMNLMRMEREELHATKHIERCEFALAPIRRIPQEILAQIFVCYRDLLGGQSECVDVKHGVWLFGHICSYWRTIALSTPDLWTFCAVSFPARTRNAPGLVYTWLERARKRPLTIRFRCLDTETYPRVGDHRRSVFERLITHCTRWADVELEISECFYSERGSVYTRLPILRQLRIVAEQVELYRGDDLVSTFSVASQLTSNSGICVWKSRGIK